MLRRVLIATPIVIVALVAAGVGYWWFFVRETHSLKTSAPDIPAELRATPGSTPGATGASGSLTFTIVSDRSEASYYADEKLASLPIPDTAKGTTKDVTGQFRVTPTGDLDPSMPATFTVDLTTLKSDRDMRDRRVQSMALETSRYPRATFTATSVTGWDPNAPAGQEQDISITGTMDLHGVQKEVTWTGKAKCDGNVITATMHLPMKYADFNIPLLNIGGFVSVQDNVTLEVVVVAQQQG